MTEFSKAVMSEVDALFERYPEKVHALLPLLHLAQRENKGWLPEGWDGYLADLCGTSVNHVRGVITFYNMFRTTEVGKYHIMACTCLPCGLCGGDGVLHHLESKLGVRPGQVTEDGLFSLEESQCLAACDKAPMIQINDEVHEKVTASQIDKLIDGLAEGSKKSQS